jgi:hypothetical protein
MKKLFAVLALVGVMTSCKDKKKDEKKTDETTTTTTTTTDATTPISGVPTFSDPEVQKFANDYAAFIAEYKAGMKDPAKLAELSKGMGEWSTRSQEIGLKLASNPEEAMAWAQWVLANTKELMPDMPDMK